MHGGMFSKYHRTPARMKYAVPEHQNDNDESDEDAD
jgi:hypothetical protein